MTITQKRKKIVNLILVMAILLLPCCFARWINPFIVESLKTNFNLVELDDNLLVHYISVGQGDATAINFPDGSIMLIDAGPNDSISTLSTYLTDKVFNNQRDKVIDYFILTHADADHISGAVRILHDFNVRTIYMPVIESDSNTYTNLVTYIEENKLHSEVISANSFELDSCKVDIIEPLDRASTNNTCPLVRIEYRGTSFLFTGDIDSSAERAFVELYGELLDVDILKVAHHGSAYSTSSEFLTIVTPDYAIISVGKNSYGHPSEDVLGRLTDIGANTYRTDESGNIMFVVGEYYDVSVLTNSYTITNMILDYRYLVIIIDGLILIKLIALAFEKTDKNGKRNTLLGDANLVGTD